MAFGKVVTLALVALVLALASRPAEAQNATLEVGRIEANLTSAGNYSTLVNLLRNATYAAALNLSTPANRTIFAPTNTAFGSLPAVYLANSTLVSQLLSYHVISSYLPLDAIVAALNVAGNQTNITTAEGQQLQVTRNGTGIYLMSPNGPTVIQTNILADGVTAVHGIDGVLVPSDAVLPSVPSPPPPAVNAAGINATLEAERIDANLTAAGNYTTLVTLLRNATLGGALNLTTPANRTIFAPTNTAFSAIPGDILANSTLAGQILSYHVVSTYLPLAAITAALNAADNKTSFTTAEGQMLQVTQNETGIYVSTPNGDPTVIQTDILADGVTAVHGIDGVLLPTDAVLPAPSPSPSSAPAPSPGSSCHLSPATGVALILVIMSALALF